MQIQDLRDDLAYLYHALLKHPSFITRTKDPSEFTQLYRKKNDATDSLDAFIDTATDLTLFFDDGHTNIEIPYTTQDRCLPIPCAWEGDSLIVNPSGYGLTAGTEILAVENVPIHEVLKRITKRIPHENLFLVKSRMIHYPYRNYHIFSDLNLKWLFGERNTYELTFKGDSGSFRKLCPLTQYDGYLDFPNDSNFVSYKIAGETAILQLDSCICNDTYINTLKDLAAQCQAKHITSLILDLSRNMGGSSAVIDEFLRYVNVDHYRRYEMIDYSSGKPEYITKRTETVPNPKYASCFPSNISCLVSHDTFSSARTFAVTLKDNGIAKIIGSPTGGKPSSFGMPKRDTLPNTGIRFRVSRCEFLRPDASKDSEPSLFPEINAK